MMTRIIQNIFIGLLVICSVFGIFYFVIKNIEVFLAIWLYMIYFILLVWSIYGLYEIGDSFRKLLSLTLKEKE